MTDPLTKAREALAEAESAAALGAADRAVYLGREALKYILAHLDARERPADPSPPAGEADSDWAFLSKHMPAAVAAAERGEPAPSQWIMNALRASEAARERAERERREVIRQRDMVEAELARLRKAMEEALVPLEAVRGHGLTYIADVRIAEALAILTSALEEKEGDPRAAESDIAQPVQDQADPAPADPAAEAMAKALKPFAQEADVRESGCGSETWRIPDDRSVLVTMAQCREARAALAAWRKEHPPTTGSGD